MAKRYFAERSIEYAQVDVMTDREGLRRMLTMTGQYGVPVIAVGSRAMVGWNAEEFDRLYGAPPDRSPRAPKR